MPVISYDQTVKDLRAGLNATGHITHANWDKTCVTFHHNGGILSHEGVLNVWKTRPASAHFDVDAHGAVAQYANTGDYAWACGNTRGNQVSISIEMCNRTTAPTWEVAETTWKSSARLAGWLFANVIGDAPTSSNVLFHSDWLATECAGPYMRSVRSQLVAEVQAAYNGFKGNHPTPSPVAPTATEWVAGAKTVTAMQKHWHTTADGEISSQDTGRHSNFPAANWTTIQWTSTGNATGSQLVRAMQRSFGLKADGLLGPATAKALQKWAGVTQDGICGTRTVHAIATKLGVK